MKRGILVLSCVAAAALSPASPGGSPARDFARLDLNGDGLLAWHEVGGDLCVERHFWAADRDQSGRVDREEFHVIGASCP